MTNQNSFKRVALCLYGRFNNRYTETSGIDGFEYIKSQILNKPDCIFDVFIYSNDLENKEKIISLYDEFIVSETFEEALDFKDLLTERGVDESKFVPIDGFRTAANTLSFLYSRKKSLDLMAEQIEISGVNYDVAICSRFDLGQIDKVNGPQPYRVSEINFNPHYDMNFIYSAMWNQMNCGFADQWFYSNPKTLNRLGEMYEAVFGYLLPDSKYLTHLAEGVVDSNADEEFSNEILKQNQDKTHNLQSYTIESAVNNHLLHKFFFYDTGLIEKAKYVSDIQGVARVVYTHTDYQDVWPLYFGQVEQFHEGFQSTYVIVNRSSDRIPPSYKQILYDDNLSYVDRLRSALEQIKEEVIFFEHEDMVLFSYPDNAFMLQAADSVKSGSFDFVKVIRGGKYYSVPSRKWKQLSKLLKFSPWIFSIQPSFWNKQKLLKLLERHRGQSIWDFEESAQSTVKKIKIKAGIPKISGPQRGSSHWDSKQYPFIATAIVKGKWNFHEYAEELGPLLEKYNINQLDRGFYDPASNI